MKIFGIMVHRGDCPKSEKEIIYVDGKDGWSVEQMRLKEGHTKDCAMIKFPLSLHSCSCKKK